MSRDLFSLFPPAYTAWKILTLTISYCINMSTRVKGVFWFILSRSRSKVRTNLQSRCESLSLSISPFFPLPAPFSSRPTWTNNSWTQLVQRCVNFKYFAASCIQSVFYAANFNPGLLMLKLISKRTWGRCWPGAEEGEPVSKMRNIEVSIRWKSLTLNICQISQVEAIVQEQRNSGEAFATPPSWS